MPGRRGNRREKLQKLAKGVKFRERARLHGPVVAACPGTDPLALWATEVRCRHARADSVGINVHAAW